MSKKLHKKYGLITAVAMVVGIVIGSGVFFKAETIHLRTGGNLPIGIIAWIIGGVIMLANVCMFAVMAAKYEKVNGIVDYAEATVGSRYAYMVGWFVTTIYSPTLASVLAWLSARYTLSLFGYADAASGLCMALACLFLTLSYAINALSPVIAGKIQVSTTAVKLVPLVLMAVVGTIAGFINGNVVQNFAAARQADTAGKDAIFAAVVSTAFAYEGWIIVTSINAELKNARRNLPLALISGSLIIIVIYILYYIGLSGAVPVKDLIDESKGVNYAFAKMFGNVAGTVLIAFIAVSCLGTLNGLMLGCTRGMYSLAARNEGPNPKVFMQVDDITDMPVNSSIIGLCFSGLWLFYFYGANLINPPIFGRFSFDSSELPVITLYGMYIPMFIMFMVRGEEKSVFKRIIMPSLAVAASLVMIGAAIYAHGIEPYYNNETGGSLMVPVAAYLIISGIIMTIGSLLEKRNKKRVKSENANRV